MFSPLEQFDIIFYYFYPIPMVNLIISMTLCLIVFLLFSIYFNENLKLIPSAFQYAIELLVQFILNLIKQQIGTNGYKYFSLIFTLFNFILIMNLFSLLPFGLALTSHIIMILWLSISLCLSIFVIGLYTHNIQFFYIFIPDVLLYYCQC